MDRRNDRPLRVLVTGSSRWAVEGVARELSSAGHEAVLCHDRGRSFPCRGIVGDPCPFTESVDVAVVVRPRPLAPMSRAEAVVVTCAWTHDTPLVVVGWTSNGPLADLAAVPVPFGQPVAPACSAAARPSGAPA